MADSRGLHFASVWLLNLAVGLFVAYLAARALWWLVFTGLVGLLNLLLWRPRWWLALPLSAYLCTLLQTPFPFIPKTKACTP